MLKTLLLALAVAAMPAPAPAAAPRDTVVVLHGIGHTRWNMYWVERALRREGYNVVNITYPSRRNNLAALAAFVQGRLAKEKVWEREGRVHFVTHSMGGLVTRRYLDTYKETLPAEKMGRLVMIAPPNGGSEVADFLRDFPPYYWLFGPAGQELTTAMQGQNAAPVWYDTGIIAGTAGWPYFVATWLIDGPHDGRVAVEKTRLPGMKDHVTVNATHSFISWRGDVHGKAIKFLKEGKFGDE